MRLRMMKCGGEVRRARAGDIREAGGARPQLVSSRCPAAPRLCVGG